MAEPNFKQSSLNFRGNLFGSFCPNVWLNNSGSFVCYSRPSEVPQESLRHLRTNEGQSGPLGLLDVPLDASRFLKGPLKTT